MITIIRTTTTATTTTTTTGSYSCTTARTTAIKTASASTSPNTPTAREYHHYYSYECDHGDCYYRHYDDCTTAKSTNTSIPKIFHTTGMFLVIRVIKKNFTQLVCFRGFKFNKKNLHATGLFLGGSNYSIASRIPPGR